MSINTKVKSLPSLTAFEGIGLSGWANLLISLLQKFMQEVKDDLTLGNTTHKVLSAVPTVDLLAEGEIVFVHLLAPVRFYMYTRINNNLCKVELTV